MLTQSIPFGMYGLGQMGGWPQYAIPPQYAVLPQLNPWAVQALLGNTLAQQILTQHLLAHQPFAAQQLFGQLPVTAGLQSMIGHPWAVPGAYGTGMGVGAGIGTGFGTGFGDRIGNGIGHLGAGAVGAGLGFPTPVANWQMPVPAMV